MNSLLTAEIRKITTLNFWWALAIPPVLVGICASAISSTIATSADELTGGDVDGVVVAGLFVAIGFSILFGAVFSAVNAGTEFRHDTITTSLLTASGRDRVIGAKIIVTTLFALAYGLIVSICSIVCLLLFTGGRFTLDGDVMTFVAAGLFGVVMLSLIGSGLGLLFGSPTWPAIIIVAWFPVGELIAVSILGGFGLDSVSAIAPAALTLSVVAAGNIDELDVLTPWPWAPILLAVWAAAAIAAGWVRTRQRDID